jgi:hypothetical protein
LFVQVTVVLTATVRDAGLKAKPLMVTVLGCGDGEGDGDGAGEPYDGPLGDELLLHPDRTDTTIVASTIRERTLRSFMAISCCYGCTG